MISRRQFISLPALLAMPHIARAAEPFPINMKDADAVENKYRIREMAFDTAEPPGTIVVQSKKRFLYLVTEPGRAIRYGCALGKGTHAWTGEVVIRKMKPWPKWIPAPYHVETKPDLAKWLPEGMPGGPDNPMGARAMYLYKGDVDTINRIHGGAKVDEIGRKATAGCIGMLNAHIVDLYARVQVGTRVVMV